MYKFSRKHIFISLGYIPRRGFLGHMVIYVAAGLQDVISGWLIDKNMTIVESVNALGEVVQDKTYDFSSAAIFWIGASVVSFLLPILNWGKKVKE